MNHRRITAWDDVVCYIHDPRFLHTYSMMGDLHYRSLQVIHNNKRHVGYMSPHTHTGSEFNKLYMRLDRNYRRYYIRWYKESTVRYAL